MEWNPKLDGAGTSAAGKSLIRCAVVFLLLSCAVLFCKAQTPSTEIEVTSHVAQLFAEGRWAEVVSLAEHVSPRSADLDFFYGSSLAQLGRWSEADTVLREGHRLAPHDERFPTELAGVAFKQKHYGQASGWLHTALRIAPSDAYANDFLGTVYFLQNNLEAALKYWNRVGKPEIENVQTEPQLRLKAALLDRMFTFSSASILMGDDLLATEARLKGSGIFSSHALDLRAREDGKFDVVFRAQERSDSKRDSLISMFRGIVYQTVYPEFFNLNDSAINLESLVRWDAQKRRARAELSGPLKRNPKWRFHTGVDLRNENWDVRNSSIGSAPLISALNLRKEIVSAGVECFPSGRWTWSTAAEFSHRDYRDVRGADLGADLLLQGYQLKHLAKLNYQLLRIPERRFVTTATIASQAGRIWSQPAHSFATFQGAFNTQWFPQARGDDYEVQQMVSAGKTFGASPFDELFMLGLERDNDLWLRAHIGTHDGRKGSAPLGSDYFLSNWEINKNIYSNGLLTFRLSPFLDIGKITDSSPNLGSHQWLFDTGLQAKARVLGIRVGLNYGKDLRTGNNVFYFTAGRRSE